MLDYQNMKLFHFLSDILLRHSNNQVEQDVNNNLDEIRIITERPDKHVSYSASKIPSYSSNQGVGSSGTSNDRNDSNM